MVMAAMAMIVPIMMLVAAFFLVVSLLDLGPVVLIALACKVFGILGRFLEQLAITPRAAIVDFASICEFRK